MMTFVKILKKEGYGKVLKRNGQTIMENCGLLIRVNILIGMVLEIMISLGKIMICII